MTLYDPTNMTELQHTSIVQRGTKKSSIVQTNKNNYVFQVAKVYSTETMPLSTLHHDIHKQPWLC